MTTKEKIENLLRKCTRLGVEDLILWLESTDFYSAPASTMFHQNYEGGLAEHSYSVYKHLDKLVKAYGYTYDEESIILCALLHDVCKIHCYEEDVRNVKENGTWVQKPYYKFVEKDKFGGHGAKSVFLVSKYIDLSFEEAAAINSHMGAYDEGTYSRTGGVYEDNKLAFLLHLADECSTYLD